MKTFDLLVIGGGMAAARLLGKLAALGYQKTTALVSSEPDAGYNRVLLPQYLAGDASRDDLSQGLMDLPLSLTIFANTTVDRLDLIGNLVWLGRTPIRFRKLVLATGSRVARPAPLADCSLAGLLCLRTLADADRMRAQLRAGQPVSVVGGGLLGLETADALRLAGCQVTVIHRGAQLLHRQVDARTSELLVAELRSRGIDVHLAEEVVAVDGSDHVERLRLSSGLEISTEMLVIATGTEPNAELAERHGIICRNGIVVDRSLRTSQPGIYALGECARVGKDRCGMVDAANAQADVLATNLTGGDEEYLGLVDRTHLKVSGLDLFAAGETRSADAEELVVLDRDARIYRRLFLRGSRLIGAVLFGDTSAARRLAESLGQTLDQSTQQRLLFGM